jgi:hypothetical protein
MCAVENGLDTADVAICPAFVGLASSLCEVCKEDAGSDSNDRLFIHDIEFLPGIVIPVFVMGQ